MPQSMKTENVNNSYFKGYYKDIWRQIFPEKITVAESEFIVEECGLQKGNIVFDIMCGYGRHSLELAKNGIKVIAVDNLEEYTAELNEKAVTQNLEIKSICADIIELQFEQEFDAVICMGNSLQFFNESDLGNLLSNISSHLKPGGKFIINSWSLSEIVNKQAKEKTWNRFKDLFLLVESKFLSDPARIETTSIIITENGEREEKQAVDYIYSLAEMEAMLNKTGFDLKEVFSIPGKKQFSPGDPRAYIVAVKK